MTRIIAVSGGVDSVVLLHMAPVLYPDEDIIVAHFDHGTRDTSVQDALFTEGLAKLYKLPFIMKREELGAHVGEELARRRRYDFLHHVARQNNASIVTAHHLDDLIETVAINFTRGTGWRGAAPFSARAERPLMAMSKCDILAYALKHGLEWREDETNNSDYYLRNRLRRKTRQLPLETKQKIYTIYERQKYIRGEVQQEAQKLSGGNPEYSRYVVNNVSQPVALELLYFITGGMLTRPQLHRLLHFVKVAKQGAIFQPGNGVVIHFSTRYFTVELLKLIR